MMGQKRNFWDQGGPYNMMGGMEPAKAQRGNDGKDGWTCQKCGNFNFGNKAFCNMRNCSAPQPKEQMEQWQCECGNINHGHRLFCNMKRCQKVKPGLTAAELGLVAGAKAGTGGVGSMGGMQPMQGAQNSDSPPGSWLCQCGNINYPTRTTCNRGVCGLPRHVGMVKEIGGYGGGMGMGGTSGKGGMGMGNGYGNGYGGMGMGMGRGMGMGMGMGTGGGFGMGGMMGMPNTRGGVKKGVPDKSGPEGSWVCSSCGNINFPTRTTCNRGVCGKPREEVDAGPPPPEGGGKGQNPFRQQAEIPDGAWTCEGCGNVNFPTRTVCNRRVCGLPRPGY